MKVTPIRQYSAPAFPTRSILDERPELLRLVPKRWQRNPVVISALVGLAAMASSATDVSASETTQPKRAAIDVESTWTTGFVIGPMAIPSEEDARRTICDEAKKAGLDFEPDVLTITIPRPDCLKGIGFTIVHASAKRTEDKLRILMDGTDKKHHVSYEYVSESDPNKWQGTIMNRDPLFKGGVTDVTDNLNSAFRKAAPSGYHRAFTAYSPLGRYETVTDGNGKTDVKATDANCKVAEQRALHEAGEDLRKQVRDFIKWLKSQGVI